MGELKLNVNLRAGVGKNRVDKLRGEGLIPGVLYGKGLETQNLEVDNLLFDKIYKEAGESTLVDLIVDGKSIPVLIKDVQKHSFKPEYIHIDFLQLDMSQTVRLTVPVILLGRENINVDGATVMQQLDEVEIECLPQDIPQSIEVDVSGITLEEAILVSDVDQLKDKKYNLLTEETEVLATLIAQTEEEEEELEEVDASDVEVIGEDEETTEE